MQTLTDIRSLLAGYGLRPKKRFGQNFLHDGNQMARILEAAGVARGELVLEVGAGTGALSERLVEAGATVVAVEVDTDLEPILRARLDGRGQQFELIMGDVLEGKHDLNPAVRARLVDRPFKLIANLPYNVASPLLVNLAVDYPRMSGAIVMVQKEVADRLAAAPGGRDYGPLTVMVQAMCEVERLFVLGPGCFWPQPEIDSAVVRLTRRAAPLTADAGELSKLVHTLFTRRRKTLRAILGRDYPWPPGIDPTARPDTLSVDELEAVAAAARDG
jgi:16S rRNA (adenine1518-N6/adenine1519-N6)-dimethyltransferase